MASPCRKRKQSGDLPPLAGEALARAILALPPQPQPICCRVEGCRQPLAPGYHKKYRICLHHSTSEQLCIEGKTCRWCQQCGRFHTLEVFDGKYRSCRYSLARHQERRKRRHAVVSASLKKSKLAQPPPQEQQSLSSEQESQPMAAGSEAPEQPQPEPLPLPAPAPAAVQVQHVEQTTAPKAAKPPKQRRRQAGGKPPGARAKQAAAAVAAAASEAQLPAEQTPPVEQRLSQPPCCKRLRQSPPPAASLGDSQQLDPAQPVTPPSLHASHAARSVPMAEVLPMGTTPSYDVPTVPAAAPPPPSQRSLWPQLQQAAGAPAEAAWGQQARAPVTAAPAEAAWGQQAPAPVAAAWAQLPAAPTTPAWSQQQPDCRWLLIIGDQRLPPVQLPMPPQAQLPAAACEVQQPSSPAFWPVQQVHHVRSGSGGGGGSGSATYFPCYEPTAVQEVMPTRIPVVMEQLPCSPFVEAAACSTSTPAMALSPRMAGTPASLPPSGSATGSAYTTTATPLSPTYGGCAGAVQAASYCAAGPAGMPSGASVWPGVSLPAAPTPPAVPPPPEGDSGSSNALNQAWAQLAWQDEQQQMMPRAATTPRAAALQPSYLTSPRAELPFSLQPSQLPSSHPAPPPSPRAVPPPNLPLSQLPSLLPLPPQAAVEPQQAQLMWQARQAQQQAQEAQQQAQQAQQQQRWDMDWADDPLIASPLDCPPSPAISWLKDFEL